MDSIEFLRTVFGENEGFLFISTKNAPSDTEITIHKAFQYPESLNTVRTYLSMREDEDVYFSPMLYSVPRRRSMSVSHTPVLYADTDTFPVDEFMVPPSINIETSPGRHASLWLLDGEYPPEEIAQASRAIALTHASSEDGKQTGVDTGGWDLTQLLRMPNSQNLKYMVKNKYSGYDRPYPVTVDEDTSPFTIYALSDITAAYDPKNLPAMPERAAMDMPDEDSLPEQKDVLRRVMSSRRLSQLYEKKAGYGEDRSEVLYHFVCECLRAGFSAEETFVVGWYASSNKYRIDGRPRDDFWHNDIRKALADPENRPRPTVEEEAASDPVLRPKDEGYSTQVEFELLREDELPTKTFVDDYVAWASSKTDAPSVYHVASAFTIMSCLFGDWGCVPTEFGDMNLGLSFVVMGETTATRKSTTRNLMKKFLRATQDDDHQYIFTSDATEEALIDALTERPDQTSLYDRDEAQKLIADVKGGKGYMKGFLETLNELYDGHARGRLRANKATKEAPVVFIQYLMGIRSQIQDNLELSDFASGWGPRQIWIRGDTPPRTRDNSKVKQQQENEHGTYIDVEFERLTARMRMMRDRWEESQRGDRSDKKKLFADPEVWDRMADLEWDLTELFQEHPRKEILTPCMQRLSNNAMKVAALFAMSEGRQRITMQDAINTRYYVARWVEDVLIMVEGVNESLYAREIKQLEKWIASKGGLVTVGAVINYVLNDMGKQRREYLDMVQVLIDRGDVLEVTDANKKPALKLVLSGD